MQPILKPVPAPAPSDTPAPAIDASILDTDGLRKARIYAKLVMGTRTSGDLLLEEAITQYLLRNRQKLTEAGCFYALLQTMRMLVRLPDADFGTPPVGIRSKALETHFALPIEVREAAALHVSSDLECSEIAVLLGCTEADVDRMLNQTWGSYLMLLGFCND